ncbi:MAG: hypothetical protein GX575_32305 [Candidatus Anammoximicrobium sp.]|nr:hypothetical protein [Candidatus Anammoximicrobium sp.]
MGFTFDDTDTSGVASSLAEMRELIRRNPKNGDRIFPYIGGKEINTHPFLAHHRYVIDFSGMTFDEAAQYPELLDIVRQRVKTERDKIGGYSVAERRRECWWHFGTATPALNKAKASLERVLVIARISNAFAVVFLPANMVFNEKTLVFPVSTYSAFVNIQSRIHEIWARFFGSTLKDDFQYTPSDCFETFPFPAGVLEHASAHSATTDDGRLTTDNPQLTALESAGREYYEFRAALMVRNNEGLTKTYNRFHDPHERSPDILKLRELHAAMDRAVLEAYGWHDLAEKATCEFLLDYEDEEESVVSSPWSVAGTTDHGQLTTDHQQLTTDHGQRTSRRKKPWRYRWPDDFRDEVLARLLALNRERAEQERLAGKAAAAAEKKNAARKPRGRKTARGGKESPRLF